ncbi:MAG TPA: hypothetical protein VGS58_20225 [Candidatus Sulfopaludibacter sp.]|nr:hypothetical protein [Candidatus Sulfopaludibacter sp.]
MFVARQPILDQALAVYGYELLYRSSGENAYTGGPDGTTASLQVLNNCFFAADIREIVGGSLAFVNFTRDLLLRQTAEVVSPRSMVVEVLEDVRVDDEVLAACRHLHDQGYLLAADDIRRADQNERLLDLVDFIKVDFREASPAEQEKIIGKYSRRKTWRRR